MVMNTANGYAPLQSERKKNGLPTQALIIIILTIAIIGIVIPWWVITHTRRIREKRGDEGRRASLISLESIHVGPDVDVNQGRGETRETREEEEEVLPAYRAKEAPPPAYCVDAPVLVIGEGGNLVAVGVSVPQVFDGSGNMRPVRPQVHSQ